MSAQPQDDEQQSELAIIDPATVELFARMATMIPSEDGGGMDRIIAAVLHAENWEKLADPWESTNAELLRGKRLRIDSLMRRPSQYKGGLGIFLVVKSVDTKTGEALVWTTSSVAVVAQLVRAYAKGWLPALAELVIADRPTEAGFYPHHLKFYAASNGG